MGYAAEEKSLHIRAHLNPSNPCISFPDDYKRSKKNSANLFPLIMGATVRAIKVIPFERSFVINFSTGHLLLFKLHGNRSNILLYANETSQPLSLFKNELKEDWNLSLDELAQDLDLSKSRFYELEGKAAAFLPTLGKIPRNWLKSQGYIEAEIEQKWVLIQEILDMLESPLFSIYQENGTYYLSLLPVPEAEFQSADPISACNYYFQKAVIFQAFDREKYQLQKRLEDQVKKTKAYIQKTSQKLEELESATPPSRLADIIMANLHQIPKGATEVELFDFYNNTTITISLKREVSPQKQAENLYRKSKNRKIEVSKLENNLLEKEEFLETTTAQVQELLEIDQFKELRDFAKENSLSPGKKVQEESLPFKKLEIDGFDVLVGRSAKANDIMLRMYAWKDDMWLHAKDVSGSHVIIKHQSGMQFPKSTLERAAEIAAYHSKSKNESVAAVIYTPCKFVRKVKGSPAGAVMVDQEKVILVKPQGG